MADDNTQFGGNQFDFQALVTTVQTTGQNTNESLRLLTAAINSKFPNWVAVPASASASGVAGQVAYQSGFFYICVSSNVWQRVAIATF